jgi:hypothetical protein
MLTATYDGGTLDDGTVLYPRHAASEITLG